MIASASDLTDASSRAALTLGRTTMSRSTGAAVAAAIRAATLSPRSACQPPPHGTSPLATSPR